MEPILKLSWIPYTASAELDFIELLNASCVPSAYLQSRIFYPNYVVQNFICNGQLDPLHV